MHFRLDFTAHISIHALREESDPPCTFALTSRLIFQSTLSVRRATEVDRRGAIAIDISIHALREESDWAILNLRAMEHEFQSTLSVRRATGYAPFLTQTDQFQSTLSVRRATQHDITFGNAYVFQSTLSMRRATHDSQPSHDPQINFNPRSP